MGREVGALRLACRFPARIKGLFGAKHGGVLLIAPCNDVHTFGMSDLLDIAFVGKDGRVIESYQAVAPFRRMRCRRAVAVLERYSTCDSPWFAVGDFVAMSRKEGDRA